MLTRHDHVAGSERALLEEKLGAAQKEHDEILRVHSERHAAAVQNLEEQLVSLRRWQVDALQKGCESDNKCKALASALHETQLQIETVKQERDAALQVRYPI